MYENQPLKRMKLEQPIPSPLQMEIVAHSSSQYIQQPQLQPCYQHVTVSTTKLEIQQFHQHRQQIHQQPQQQLLQQQHQSLFQQQYQFQLQQQQHQLQFQQQSEEQPPQQSQQQLQPQHQSKFRQLLHQQSNQHPQPELQQQLQLEPPHFQPLQKPQPDFQQQQPPPQHQSQLQQKHQLQQVQPQHQSEPHQQSQPQFPQQQQFQLQNECLQPQQKQLSLQQQQELLEIMDILQSIVESKNIEQPVHAWTQTKEDDFPKRTNHSTEALLLAKIRELEETLKNQAEFINQLKAEKLKKPSPSQLMPSTTTITPNIIEHEGRRYRLITKECDPSPEPIIPPGVHNYEECACSPPSYIKRKPVPQKPEPERRELVLSYETCTTPPTPLGANDPNIFFCQGAMASLGPAGTRISAHDYALVAFTSPIEVTGKLLHLVFHPETLATHSITGKPSPALKSIGRPIQGKLCSDSIHDIVFVVSARCKVPKKEVRAAITTICDNENINSMNRKRAAVMDLAKINLSCFGDGDT